MTFLPRSIDVYMNNADIFTPLSEDLNRLLKRLQKRVSSKTLNEIKEVLTKVYRHAPPSIKELIPECRSLILKLGRALTNYVEGSGDKKKKAEKAAYNLVTPLISDLTLISKELKLLSDKEAGLYYVSLPNRFNVTVGDYDNTGNRVEFVRNPVYVSVMRPLDNIQMDKPCKPIQQETFFYILEHAMLVGIHPNDLPKKLEPDRLRKAILNLTGKIVHLASIKGMKHSTSNRIWFLVDELGVPYRSIQFADRHVSDNSNFVQEVLAETDEYKISQLLLGQGFTALHSAEILTRLQSVIDLQTKSNILTNELLNLKTRLKSDTLRARRMAFEQSQKDIKTNIRLLDDDYQKTLEDMEVEKQRFIILTSVDATPETGLHYNQYKKIDAQFNWLERQQTRGMKDIDHRNQLRRGLKQTRLEARLLYHSIKYEMDMNRKRIQTIKKLKAKYERNKLEAFSITGGKNDFDQNLKDA